MAFFSAQLLQRVNMLRPFIGIILATLLLFCYRPDQDVWTYYKFHHYNPLSSYYGLHPMAQNGVVLLILALVYIKFEPEIRWWCTLMLWSEAAADSIVLKNKAEAEEKLRELNRSIRGSSDRDWETTPF